MAKGPDWNDLHRTNPGGVRDAMTEPDIPFDDPPRAQTNGEAHFAKELPGHSKAPVPVKILTYDEMLAMPEPDFLVFGVVPRRGKTCLFGVSNSFKTFIAVDLGGSVSTGITYHGMATRKCKTFYVANEGAAGVGRKRIAAWMAYHDIPQADRRNIFLITVETILPNETSRNNLIAGIASLSSMERTSSTFTAAQ
jgi:hypothetical protein